jgi:hypothetical protein
VLRRVIWGVAGLIVSAWCHGEQESYDFLSELKSKSLTPDYITM